MSTTGGEQLVSANIELACVVLKDFSPVLVKKAFSTANYRANGGWTSLVPRPSTHAPSKN